MTEWIAFRVSMILHVVKIIVSVYARIRSKKNLWRMRLYHTLVALLPLLIVHWGMYLWISRYSPAVTLTILASYFILSSTNHGIDHFTTRTTYPHIKGLLLLLEYAAVVVILAWGMYMSIFPPTKAVCEGQCQQEAIRVFDVIAKHMSFISILTSNALIIGLRIYIERRKSIVQSVPATKDELPNDQPTPPPVPALMLIVNDADNSYHYWQGSKRMSDNTHVEQLQGLLDTIKVEITEYSIEWGKKPVFVLREHYKYIFCTSVRIEGPTQTYVAKLEQEFKEQFKVAHLHIINTQTYDDYTDRKHGSDNSFTLFKNGDRNQILDNVGDLKKLVAWVKDEPLPKNPKTLVFIFTQRINSNQPTLQAMIETFANSHFEEYTIKYLYPELYQYSRYINLEDNTAYILCIFSKQYDVYYSYETNALHHYHQLLGKALHVIYVIKENDKTPQLEYPLDTELSYTTAYLKPTEIVCDTTKIHQWLATLFDSDT